jgi:hypothetical protein
MFLDTLDQPATELQLLKYTIACTGVGNTNVVCYALRHCNS